MNRSIRTLLKEMFDGIVYKSATINWLLREANKKLSFLTSFRLRPFGVLTVKLQSGVKFKMTTNETSSVTKKIFWHGADNYEYTKIFERLAGNTKVFYDVGSSIGYYSLLAVKANSRIKVCAFEPASAPFHYLKKNILLNELSEQVSAFPVALSDRGGEIEFFEFRSQASNRLNYNLGGAGSLKINFESQRLNTVAVKVACDTMDNFCATHKLPFPDLIKMDTEGTENLVLSGSQKILASKPIIICETLFNTIEAELTASMKPHGYDFYNFNNGQLIKVDTLVRSEDNGVRDCFFVHPSKVHFIKDFISPN
jgi:FkbM family methyltransferase